MFSKEEVEVIRGTWMAVATNRDKAGEIFYNKLFQHAPEVKCMFADSPKVQGRKLMETLATVVDGLDRIDSLVPFVKQLGQLHTDTGVKPQHYDIVGATLIETLREMAGGRFDAKAEAAWKKAYDALAGIMKTAGPGSKAA